jgi:hypothetical protein
MAGGPSAGAGSFLPAAPVTWPASGQPGPVRPVRILRHAPVRSARQGTPTRTRFQFSALRSLRFPYSGFALAGAGLDDAFNTSEQTSLDRSRGGTEPRPGKGPVLRCRCLARAFAFLGRSEATPEATCAVPRRKTPTHLSYHPSGHTLRLEKSADPLFSSPEGGSIRQNGIQHEYHPETIGG